VKDILSWDIYEITTRDTPINGVMLRGRIRKLWLENWINILAENTQDIESSVRFATLHWESNSIVIDYLHSIMSDVNIKLVLESVQNPVLSKLKINKEERYTL